MKIWRKNRIGYISIIALTVTICSFLLACGSSGKNLSFKSLSKKTTIEEVRNAFGEEDHSYETDYCDIIMYEELSLSGIYANNPLFFFAPESGTLMRIQFRCSNKGVTKDGIEKLIETLSKTDGKPVVEDKIISGDYYTCYYWKNDTHEFKCVAFSVDEDYVEVMLNYDWWLETVNFNDF